LSIVSPRIAKAHPYSSCFAQQDRESGTKAAGKGLTEHDKVSEVFAQPPNSPDTNLTESNGICGKQAQSAKIQLQNTQWSRDLANIPVPDAPVHALTGQTFLAV